MWPSKTNLATELSCPPGGTTMDVNDTEFTRQPSLTTPQAGSARDLHEGPGEQGGDSCIASLPPQQLGQVPRARRLAGSHQALAYLSSTRWHRVCHWLWRELACVTLACKGVQYAVYPDHLGLLVVVGFGAPGRPSLAKPSRVPGRTTPAVQVDMRNVMYHFTDQIAVHVHQLQGRVLPTPRARLPVFDDVESFTFAIAFAEIALRLDTLSHLLNHYVFAAPDAPLKEIAVTTTGNTRLKVQGKLQAGTLPFTLEGTPAVTPEGAIRLRTHSIAVASVPVKGLLDVLGLKIAELVNTAQVPGVRLEGNDLLLDPAQLLPPPRIAGRVTAVYVNGAQILQVFGTKPPAGATPPTRGITWRIGGPSSALASSRWRRRTWCSSIWTRRIPSISRWSTTRNKWERDTRK